LARRRNNPTPVEIEFERVKRILVIRLDSLSNVVRTFPALATVAKHFPDAEITYLTQEKYLELMEPCPYISNIILYNNPDTIGFMRLAKSLRKKKFDLVLNLQNTKKFDMLARATGARYRSNIVTPGRPLREIETVYRILETVGISPGKMRFEFWFSVEDREFARVFFHNNGLEESPGPVGLCPGAEWRSKQWQLRKFAELGDRLAGPGGKIIIFGTEEEIERAEQIRHMSKSRVLISTGKTSIREAGCLISKCRVFVSNETGLMHISALLGVPTVGIFGSTNPAYHGPSGFGNMSVYRGVDCSPCNKPDCKLDEDRYYCLNNIDVQEVYDAARHAMQTTG